MGRRCRIACILKSPSQSRQSNFPSPKCTLRTRIIFLFGVSHEMSCIL